MTPPKPIASSSRWGLVAFFLVLFGIVVLQNTAVTEVRFLFWELSMSRVVLLALTLGLGVLVGWLIGRRR